MVEKIALVTGSSRGLGLQVAKLLSTLKYRVILTGRSKRTLEIVREQLHHPGKHIIFYGDLLQKKNIQAICDAPFFPDVIVHNVGGKIDGDEQPLDSAILRQSIELNLSVAVELNKHYLPPMQKIKNGRIIHVSSDASETGRSAPGYAAAKAAVNTYVKSTARFYAKHNVMVCAVLPGIFLHPGSDWDKKNKKQNQHYHARLQEQPLNRFLYVNEVAELIVDIAITDNMACAGSLIKLTGGF